MVQARQFSWERTAARALDAIERRFAGTERTPAPDDSSLLRELVATVPAAILPDVAQSVAQSLRQPLRPRQVLVDVSDRPAWPESSTAEALRAMTVSISELRESIGIFIEDLRKQFEHLMDPGFRNWIEGLAGITLSADSSLITRASVIEEVSQSYANGIESLTSQIAAAQMELDALGSATGGAERNALVSKLRNLEMMLGDVTGALGSSATS